MDDYFRERPECDAVVPKEAFELERIANALDRLVELWMHPINQFHAVEGRDVGPVTTDLTNADFGI